MILALDTAGPVASVALGRTAADARMAVHEGAREHAARLLPMADALLREAQLPPRALAAVVVADGPGSFTGLRVGATVGKALARLAGCPLLAAPALLAVAWDAARRQALVPDALVVSVDDALRGEVYAAAYRVAAQAVETVMAPTVLAPTALRDRVAAPALLVGRMSTAARETLSGWARQTEEAVPGAAALIALAGMPGGAVPVPDVAAWEPVYGRPAEAQAKWEREHGRPLPAPAGDIG